MPAKEIVTPRLRLRRWKEEDLFPFATMNADPRVMECFPSTLTKEESDQLAHRIEKELSEKEFGLWAVERLDTNEFIGFVGIHEVNFSASFTPCIEIGWRLSYDSWGQGFAAEAANAVLNYTFHILEIQEVVSFTPESNLRSIKLMERLGMTRDPDEDFDHPNLPSEHPLRRHILYRLYCKEHPEAFSA